MISLLAKKQEVSALMGLPYIQQVTYLLGIKPYMDHQTSIVGIKRRISYQSLAEALYIEPHPGIRSGSPSREQLRRIIKALERAGLVQIQSDKKHLILKCLLAERDNAVQNKPDTIPTSQVNTKMCRHDLSRTRVTEGLNPKPDIDKTQKTDTPHKDNNYLFFLLQKFETFWNSYPQRQGKQKAWQVFQSLKPDEHLMQQILKALEAQVAAVNEKKALGLWVPNWKHPANWLTQQCWEDEIVPVTPKEKTHASHRKNYSATEDFFWESCKSGAEDDVTEENNVIDFACYREGS